MSKEEKNYELIPINRNGESACKFLQFMYKSPTRILVKKTDCQMFCRYYKGNRITSVPMEGIKSRMIIKEETKCRFTPEIYFKFIEHVEKEKDEGYVKIRILTEAELELLE